MFGQRLSRKFMGGYNIRSRPPRFRVRRRPQGEDPRGPRERRQFILIVAALTTAVVLPGLVRPSLGVLSLAVIALLVTLAGFVAMGLQLVRRRPPPARKKRHPAASSQREP